MVLSNFTFLEQANELSGDTCQQLHHNNGSPGEVAFEMLETKNMVFFSSLFYTLSLK
jgi:hypothetical protein